VGIGYCYLAALGLPALGASSTALNSYYRRNTWMPLQVGRWQLFPSRESVAVGSATSARPVALVTAEAPDTSASISVLPRLNIYIDCTGPGL
jgi:hypothetical protein